MLIEFSVANFRSYEQKQSFSMVKAGIDGPSNYFESGCGTAPDLVRSALIFGANASGKSNLLLAMGLMRRLVITSATDLKPGDELDIEPFRLSKKSRKAPSEFEAIFVTEGVRYQYGFSATNDRVISEWLYAWPKKRVQVLYERNWNTSSEDYDWHFGAGLTGQKQTWRRSTRENCLFLSMAAQQNSDQLTDVYDWFRCTLKVATHSVWGSGVTARMIDEGGTDKKEVVDFLRRADLPVDDINIHKEPFDPRSHIPEQLPKPMADVIKDSMAGKDVESIMVAHLDREGSKQVFDYDDESHGTRRIIDLAGPWVDSIKNGYVLVIDELDLHLHAKLIAYLVKEFHKLSSEESHAQLIFTTHNLSLLDQNVFRRDQYWFVEADDNRASTLTSLSEFKASNRERLQESYLSGRFGALPYVDSLDGCEG